MNRNHQGFSRSRTPSRAMSRVTRAEYESRRKAASPPWINPPHGICLHAYTRAPSFVKSNDLSGWSSPARSYRLSFFHEGEVRGVNGDVRLLYFFFYAGTKRWRYHVIFLQIASFPRWGYFSLSFSLSSYRNGQVEGNRWSDKLLVNGDKHSKYDHERKEERSRSAVSSHLLSVLSFFFPLSVLWISYHCPTFLLPTFFLSPRCLRCFHGNSLDIKTRVCYASSLLYALLRHKRTVVKRTIVNTIEQTPPISTPYLSLFAFPCVIPLLRARTILLALCRIRYAVGFTRIIYDGLLSSIQS